MKLSKSSTARIKAFIDWFIRSNFMQLREFGSTSDDWIHDPERMQRCDDAAKDGADGSTHREHIDDWRSVFDDWIRWERNRDHDYSHFKAAVEQYFDDLEEWHEKNGSLDQQVG